jgi:hypothetical protein
MTSRFAAPQLASLSVIMTRGGRICLFSSLRNGRLAACLPRRCWTRTSSTTPLWSVHGSPKPMLYPTNFEHDLIQMPLVADPGEAATDLVGEMLTELARLLSDSFVADDNATGRQQLLHQAQPERETEI